MLFPDMSQPRAKVSRRQYQALASFRYALRRFLRFSEEAAHEIGLTTQQHQALLAIKGFPDEETVTVGHLAERLQIRHHSAVGLVDRLAAEHFVARKHSFQDRRQVEVVLTAKGEEILERLSATHRDQLRRIGLELQTHLRGLTEDLDDAR